MTNLHQVNFELSQDNINVQVSVFDNTADIHDDHGNHLFSLEVSDLTTEEVVRNLEVK